MLWQWILQGLGVDLGALGVDLGALGVDLGHGYTCRWAFTAVSHTPGPDDGWVDDTETVSPKPES